MKQKYILKVNFTTKGKIDEYSQQSYGKDNTEIKQSLLTFINESPIKKQKIQRQMKRTRSSITNVDLIKDKVAVMEIALNLITHFHSKLMGGQTIYRSQRQ